MKLPNHVTCYGNPCNAIDIKTGTMIDINSTNLRIDLEIIKAYNIDTMTYI